MKPTATSAGAFIADRAVFMGGNVKTGVDWTHIAGTSATDVTTAT
jgi:hypothetical protein